MVSGFAGTLQKTRNPVLRGTWEVISRVDKYIQWGYEVYVELPRLSPCI